MRNIEKICQWLGMVKPEQMRNGSRHEDLKGDTVALAKLVMKEGEKPGKFLLPHGMILLGWWLRMFMEDNPYGIQNQSSFRIMELSVYSLARLKTAGVSLFWIGLRNSVSRSSTTWRGWVKRRREPVIILLRCSY